MAEHTNNTTAMKTTLITRTALTLATVLSLGFTQAAEPVRLDTGSKRTALERNLDRALNRYMTFPVDKQADLTGEVFVSFVIDKEGRVEVIDCNSTNERLKEHVLNKLARIDIGENPDGIWRTTHMRISFRPERSEA